MPCPRSLSPQSAQLAPGTLPGAGGVQLLPPKGCPLLSNRTPLGLSVLTVRDTVLSSVSTSRAARDLETEVGCGFNKLTP